MHTHDITTAYYVPTIPDVYSTDRYQHALALTEHFKQCHIISNNTIPEQLTTEATSTIILSESSVLEFAREAAIKARRRAANGIFLTSPHYESGTAGMIVSRCGLSSPTWIADVYETPAQYRLNNPLSFYQIAARGLAGMMKLANHGIHSVHPNTPYQYGRTRSFINNGAPVSRVEPSYASSEPLHVVWVGSPRLDRGGRLLLGALDQVDSPIILDIYGHEHSSLIDRMERLPSKHDGTHHGWSDHQDCLQATREADVAYCVLPSRPDWVHAPAIKIGESLAGGTIPLVSPFPGSQQLAGTAGEYVSPEADNIAEALDMLSDLSNSELKKRKHAARERGEEVNWHQIREEFAQQIANVISSS